MKLVLDPYPLLNILSPVCVCVFPKSYEEKKEKKITDTHRKEANKWEHTLKQQGQRTR